MRVWQVTRAGLLVVVVVGLAMGGLALAQDTSTPDRDAPVPYAAYERILDLLAPLVDDGTLTEDQAVAVADRLADTLPGRPDATGGLLARLAELLGVTAADIRHHVAAGGSIAELAEAQGLDPGELVAMALAPLAERLAAAVAGGHLTQAEADGRLAEARERLARRLAAAHRPPRDRVGDVLADELGVTPAELREAAEAGESLAEVAEAQGVDTDQLVDRLVAPVEERLADAVAEGDLSEDEAAAKLDQARDHVTDRVTRPIRDRPRERPRDR